MKRLSHAVKALWRQEEGQGLVEYALILVLVSIVAIGALAAIGGGVTNVLQAVSNHLNPVH
jgi:pilus assembly protein Flp/PilA